MNSSFAMKLALVGLSAIIISGCAETRNVMRVQEAAETKIWPTPPETPRYRYVGQLTGEKNFIDPEKGSGTSFVGFLKALVGLGSEDSQERTLHRPGSGIVDSAGRILVTDVGRQAIFVFDEKQGKLDIWNAASEEFNFTSPVAIAQARNGDILVTDSKLNRVVRLDSEDNPRG
ncbi:hypothetical protein, partial [Kaarinaea lacus]